MAGKGVQVLAVVNVTRREIHKDDTCSMETPGTTVTMFPSGSSQVFSLPVAAVAAQQHVVRNTQRTRVRESVPAPQDLYPAGPKQSHVVRNPHGIEMILEKGDSEIRESQDDLVRM